MKKHLFLIGFSFLLSSAASAACVEPKADSSPDFVRENQVECLQQSRFILPAHEASVTQTPEFQKLLVQPQSKKGDQLLNDSVIYCRFVPVDQNGMSTKFRCAQTNSSNQLMNSDSIVVPEAVGLKAQNDDFLLTDSEGKVIMAETKKGNLKPVKAHIMKVRYWDRSARNVEGFTSSAASRVLWALGVPAHTNIMTEKIVCFGCDKSPFRVQKQALKGVVNEFPHASIEIKFKGDRLYSPTEDAWKWAELNALHARSSAEIKNEIEVLALAAQFIGAVGETTMQNALVCQKFKKDSEECESVIAMIHDIGASFGNRVKTNPFQRGDKPRGDIKAFESARIFKNGTCDFNFSDGGRKLPLNITRAAQEEFLRRAQALTRESLKVIFTASHMGSLMNSPAQVPEEQLVDRWVQATLQKLDEVRSAPCQ